MADAQEVQMENKTMKDLQATEDTSPTHGGSYVGLCYMASSESGMGLSRPKGLLS